VPSTSTASTTGHFLTNTLHAHGARTDTGRTSSKRRGMIGKAPRPRQFCKCGARLNWEARLTAGGTRWLATCRSVSCGRITLQRNDADEPEDGLKTFLLGTDSPRPYRPRWITLFLESLQRTEYEWTPCEHVCWQCTEPDVIFTLNCRPLSDPYECVVCLRCGAVTTASVTRDSE
jgi:hypothetical protein